MSRNRTSLKRILTADALLRATGAPLIRGNQVRVLRDAQENYPEWERAMRSAEKTIHLENYIIRNDSTGRRFRDLLAEQARKGVKVRVLYDWFGSFGPLANRMWKAVRSAGGEVLSANPPRWGNVIGWGSRNHRKLLVVDGSMAFISGLCIGDDWAGNPEKGKAPWRDTGIFIQGPAVADAESAFAGSWKIAGGQISPDEICRREDLPRAGSVALRIVATSPETAGLYRLDLLVAAGVRENLWLTDAYFIGTTTYVQALRSAALDGVDVRLLVPHDSDVQWIANFSRTQYRTLLEAGVRVFEWQGPMIHAKTAVADGRWARVGSTNLNIAGWLGNWELDVVIEDEGIGREMAAVFLEDLSHSVEVVLTGRRRVRPSLPLIRGKRPAAFSGSGRRVLTGVLRMSSAFSAAVTSRRMLNQAESASLFSIAFFLLALAGVAFFLPRVITLPLTLVLAWMGIFLLIKGARLRWFSREAGRKAGPAVPRRRV